MPQGNVDNKSNVHKKERFMTITLPLQPQEEARLKAVAHAKGLSADALVREALERILADASEIPDSGLAEPASGALLVAAMQASPYKKTDLESVGGPLLARNILLE
jgi:hypothetical protein